MAKTDFCSRVIEKLIYCIENKYLNIQELIANDEDIRLAFLLTYMSLSKEKIIKKDIKNKDMLDRLDKRILTKDIDVLFSKTNSPNNFSAACDENIWILDNIRDSLMHEQFEIDEANKLIIINNTGYNRDLYTEIPYSWFEDYISSNISNKVITDKYTYKGSFYNIRLKNRKKIYYDTALDNTILFKLFVDGKELSIYELDRIIEDCMQDVKDMDEKDIINNDSFEMFKIALTNKIQEIYPGSNVIISKININKKFKEKAKKRIYPYNDSYDVMFEKINGIFKRKGYTILKLMESIYNNNYEYSPSNLYDERNINNIILIYMLGIVSIVWNYEELKTNSKIRDFFKYAYVEDQGVFENYKNILVRNYKELIENMIYKQKTINDYNKCPIEKKTFLEGKLKKITADENKTKETIHMLQIDFSLFAKKNLNDIDEIYPYIREIINYFEDETFSTKHKEMYKDNMLKIIERCIDSLKGKVAFNTNNSETLEIVRNSLAHIGRIDILNLFFKDEIVFDDYDNNHNKSGRAVVSINDFLNFNKYTYNIEEKDKSLVLKKD